ncbi:MAG: DNA polymerase I [Balneolales bacterium]
MSRKKLFLLDGTALAYRAYFAFIKSQMRNSEGLPTGTIFGFANTIDRLLASEEPTHIAVIWDTHEPTFRHAMDANYKANRPSQPDELREAIPEMKRLIELYGINNFEQHGYEADDIIGTLAVQARNEHVDVFMVTPDKDFMQLICDNIKMYKPLNSSKGFEIVDIEGVKDYFGVPPEKVIDVLAIIGDASDNIPGVPGVGKKGAPQIIKEYGSLEKAIQHASEIKSKRAREGLMNNSGQARLAREMITIKTDVPDTVDWKELEWKGCKTIELGEFYKKMEFRTLVSKYLGETLPDRKAKKPSNGQTSLFGDTESEENVIVEKEVDWKVFDEETCHYKICNDLESIDAMLEEMKAFKVICFDTEATDVNAMTAELLGISLASRENHACYIPLNGDGLDKQVVLAKLRPLFESEDVLKIAQNYKYDYLMLRNSGIEVRGKVFDTMLAAYLLDSGQKMSMDALARKYLKYDPISIETLIGKGRKQINMSEVPMEDLVPYACEDSDITFQLYEILHKELEQEKLTQLAEEIEFPLSRVIGDMEINGIEIDKEMLAVFSKDLREEINALEEKIYEVAGEAFNINSPAQLGVILFQKLNLPSRKKTAGGQYSTSESVLSRLAVNYEMPRLILEYRALAKLKSTYVDALPKISHPETGRIHSSFNQHITATGRLSSSAPNLQNIPIRTERGREIRKAFKAAKGSKLIAADYSQIELRVIASIANDENMKEAFRNDEDIHARTAKEIFGISGTEEVDREQRRKAKEVNFGIPYGVSSYGLASRLGVDNNEGKKIIDAFFGRFSGIKKYIEDTMQFARDNGYVETLSGRRRFIRDINSPSRTVRSFAERTAINMPVQGTAADLIKIAMIKVDKALREAGLKAKMLLQVHDELVFEVPDAEVEEASKLIKHHMEHAMDIDVPIKVELGVADNWLDAH